MTESEWLEGTDPTPMVELLRTKASERKLRLFGLGCCYRIRHLIPDQETIRAVGVAERIVEGHPPGVDLDDLASSVWQRSFAYIDGFQRERASRIGYHSTNAVYHLLPPVPPPTIEASNSLSEFLDSYSPGTWSALFSSQSQPDLLDSPTEVAWAWANHLRNSDDDPARENVFHQEMSKLVPLLRDIFGNPFRPASFNPACLTPTVSDLAQSAYEERIIPSGELDPSRLAVLSDALEEAGCDNKDILGHLRSAGPHVRGCWAVDLLLAKE